MLKMINMKETSIRNLQIQVNSLENQLEEQSRVTRGLSEREEKNTNLQN